MKNKLFVCTIMCMFSWATFSQLKVASNGKVGIGINQTPLSNLSAGTVGDSETKFSFEGSGCRTMLIRGLGLYNSFSVNLAVSSDITSGTGDRGIFSDASKPNPTSSGRALAIVGLAGNATSGYNYGVIGSIWGSNNGTGILGSSTGNYLGSYIDGKYAGYFEGNVKVSGTINGTLVGNSDVRFKQNITDLGSNDQKNEAVLKRITSLIPISYNYKQVYHDVKSDTIVTNTGFFDEKSQLFQKKHYGLVAQDLQEIYPDLVYENDNGYLAINYTEIIPLLIQSIKELKEEVDKLASAAPRSATSTDFIDDMPRAVLYQNAPNPFTDRTEIKYSQIGRAHV